MKATLAKNSWTPNPRNTKLPQVPIQEFNAIKQASLFQLLKQPQFSGQLILQGLKGQAWTFHFYLGRILYATGGEHPVRRWLRHVSIYCPEVYKEALKKPNSVQDFNPAAWDLCWEYQLLCWWVKQQKISREQAAKLVHAIIKEVLFDVNQSVQVTYSIKQDTLLPVQLFLINTENAIEEAWQLWQAWQTAKIADRSPNKAPVIRQMGQLQELTSSRLFSMFSHLLDGRNTLRDLAVKMKHDVLDVTRLLLPFIQAGGVKLVSIPDLPAPTLSSPPPKPKPTAAARKPVIACIDDSVIICQAMEEVLTKANYNFFSVMDPLRAIATLLASKPDLIFLDLIMPNTNGYEICSQLRKLSFFRNTPIVILTGNDGLVDRVRSKLVGATDFLSKPASSEAILTVIQKHLRQPILNS